MAYDKDTVLVICNTVPIDRKYQHTLYFDTQADQEDYFDAKVDYSFDNMSYQRVSKNKVRVAILADKIYGDNYLYFKNFATGTYEDEDGNTYKINGKRFYAFIVDVTYINDNTSEITYEIDVMQTWHFNYQLGKCFVEREHVEDDTIGLHTIPEPVDASAIKCTRVYSSTQLGGFSDFESYSVVIATGYDIEHTPGGMYSGIPSGLNYAIFDIDSTGISDFLDYLQACVDDEKDDAIVSIWMQPTCTIDTTGAYESEFTYDSVTLTIPSNLDNYPVQNNKLLTYPYNYIVVDTGSEQAEYRWEWFNNSDWSSDDDPADAAFFMYASTCPAPEMMCVPLGYNLYPSYGTSTTYSRRENYTEAVVLRDFPQVAWASDAYRAWVAGGGYTTMFIGALGGAGQIAAGTASIASGNVGAGVNAVTSGLTGIASTINQSYHEANKGATGHGTQSGSAMVGSRKKDFYFKRMQLSYNQAKSIDDFFTMYGYQVNCIKVPNRSYRPYWNYVKTRNCKITYSTVPADDASKIESIYDNGITFWNPSTPVVGSYNYVNYY